jgi:molecular chaperone IbpA
MTQVSRFDTTSLAQLNRALVGFDRLFDGFESRFANQLANNYPPHNVVKLDETRYAIEIAVAGFKRHEINVEIEQEVITVRGDCETPNESTNRQYLHKGLSSRNFERSWQLAEHMIVKGAEMKDGILTINLEYVIPEEKKARIIDVIEVK